MGKNDKFNHDKFKDYCKEGSYLTLPPLKALSLSTSTYLLHLPQNNDNVLEKVLTHKSNKFKVCSCSEFSDQKDDAEDNN